MLANPHQWQQCCPAKKDTDRTAEISRWRKFARGVSQPLAPDKKKKKTNHLALSGGAAVAVSCFPYARQGRIRVYFFEDQHQVGQYEIIGNYREDTKAMKALKAGVAPRTREKGQKCLQGVEATQQSDKTYNITFTGFRGHTYVVSMRDKKSNEMVQQWFHTQFQVETTELPDAPAGARRVQYTWKACRSSGPTGDAATATYKDETIPLDAERPVPPRRHHRHRPRSTSPSGGGRKQPEGGQDRSYGCDAAGGRAAAGGGKLAAAVAWPEEHEYEEDQM